MKENFDIDILRIALERYYAGELSCKEIGNLRDRLSRADRLPPDLQKERDVFLLIENPLFSEDPPISAPPHLSENIFSEIDRRSRKHRFRLAIISVASAAAILVIFNIGWRVFSVSTGNNDTVSPPHVAQATAPKDTLETTNQEETLSFGIPHSEIAVAEATQEIGNISSIRKGHGSLPNPHSSQRIASPNSGNNTLTQEQSHFREITDPEEAALIIDKVMVMMNQKMFEAELACEEPAIKLESINRTLNRVNL